MFVCKGIEFNPSNLAICFEGRKVWDDNSGADFSEWYADYVNKSYKELIKDHYGNVDDVTYDELANIGHNIELGIYFSRDFFREVN